MMQNYAENRIQSEYVSGKGEYDQIEVKSLEENFRNNKIRNFYQNRIKKDLRGRSLYFETHY